MSKLRPQPILETIPAFVWLSDSDGAMEYFNQQLSDYCGLRANECVRNGWFIIVHPEDSEAATKAWESAVATADRYEATYRIRRSDGVFQWVRAVAQPIRDGRGRTSKWCGLFLLIDESKQAEETHRKTRAQLLRAIQIASIAELSAAVVHEINQPLAAVLANGQACLRWLSANPPSVERARVSAKQVIEDAKDAADVVSGLLQLFRQASSQEELFDINSTLFEVLRLFDEETTAKGITIISELSPHLPLISADRRQIKQVCVNLLRNAFQAIEGQSDTLVFVSSKLRQNDMVEVSVRDYGVGIDDPDRVFEAFFSTKNSGLGMGLAVSRSIIEAHNGSIWATAVNGKGTAITFTLPLVRVHG